MSRSAAARATPERGAAPAPRRALFPMWRQVWRQWRRVPSVARKTMSWGLPILLLIGCFSVYALGRSAPGQTASGAIYDQLMQATAALGLVVVNIEVDGRETTDATTILAALAANRGTPILSVSPSRAKQQLEELPWVRSAAIERRLPGTLYVRLVERHPLAVWQHAGRLDLIDRDGDVISVTDLSRFAKLPTVVGESANKHAARLLAILDREPELSARVTAIVRVDDRRWNVRIDNMIDVMLPEEKPDEAWARLAALERENSVLKRDLQSVDLRLPDRLVLRTAAPPQKEAAPAKPRPAGKNI